MTHKYEQEGSYPSHIIEKYVLYVAVTDVRNCDMNGYSKQQKIPNLAHTGE